MFALLTRCMYATCPGQCMCSSSCDVGDECSPRYHLGRCKLHSANYKLRTTRPPRHVVGRMPQTGTTSIDCRANRARTHRTHRDIATSRSVRRAACSVQCAMCDVQCAARRASLQGTNKFAVDAAGAHSQHILRCIAS